MLMVLVNVLVPLPIEIADILVLTVYVVLALVAYI